MLQSLDFIYMPSRDVARDLAHYEDALGGEVTWAIERFGTRVAEVSLGGDGPRTILAQHLEGDAPVMVFRVADLEAALAELEGRGATVEFRFEFPYGPGARIAVPGSQRLAIYERSRPERGDSLRGRRDFEPERSPQPTG